MELWKVLERFGWFNESTVKFNLNFIAKLAAKINLKFYSKFNGQTEFQFLKQNQRSKFWNFIENLTVEIGLNFL